jgi:hypothetical protein
MDELEKEGVVMLRQYGMFLRMNKPMTAFLRRVAERLNWKEFAALL